MLSHDRRVGDCQALAGSLSNIFGSEEWLEDSDDETAESDTATIIEVSGRTLADIERDAIRSALAVAKGDKRKAAIALDVSTKTIYNKIAKYNL